MAGLNNIAVFCGSQTGNDPAFAATAEELGTLMAERDIGLVYGGASIGMMGIVADACIGAGGRVYGVIPKKIADYEVAHQGLSELHIVDGMHQRKALMADLSDAFIAAPGGIGTNEEIFEMWTWSQLGFHEKSCSFLNVGGFFDHLLQYLQNQVDQGFLKQQHLDMVLVESDAGALLDALESHDPKATPKIIPPD
jgi:uncharacterized protein (TIGR00730 family)